MIADLFVLLMKGPLAHHADSITLVKWLGFLL